MALAHLCKEESAYADMVRFMSSRGTYVILDNSYFELGESCTLDVLLDKADLIGAKCVVLPDGDFSGVAACRARGLDVMCIPMGDNMSEDFLTLMNDEAVTYVGLSYIHANRYLGLPKHNTQGRAKFLASMDLSTRKVHLLGCINIKEMRSLVKYSDCIVTQDTSLAVWAGMNRWAVCQVTGKYSLPVDFNSKLGTSSYVWANIGYMEGVYDVVG